MMVRANNRYAVFVCFFVLILGLVPGCGGKYNEANNDTVKIEVAGTLSLRGGQPYPILLLETADGAEYLLRSALLLDELKNLKGLRAMLRGTTLAHPSVTIPVLAVDSYRLLPFAGGEEPLVGTLEIAEERCVLCIDDDIRLTIVGEFERVLDAFPGAKIWVIGERPDGKSIRVTGYGIIASSDSP